MSDAYRLLVLLARLEGDRSFYETLGQAVAPFNDWETFVTLAEKHSMAPLAYHHFRELGFPIPAQIKQQLQGLFLRHKLTNETRFRALVEILAVFEQAEIPVIVLKGGVLAPLVYPELGYRPMRDLDLLIAPTHLKQAEQLLNHEGYTKTIPNEPILSTHHHLPTMIKPINGLDISVELHFSLPNGFQKGVINTPFSELWNETVSFSIGELQAKRLSNETMLWHLYTHMLSEEMRASRIVDFVQFAELVKHEVDWHTLQKTQSKLFAGLGLMQQVTFLSADLAGYLGLSEGTKTVAGADTFLVDWPPKLSRQELGKNDSIKQLFFPSEMTLRFYYGLASDASIGWHRYVYHPLQVVYWTVAQRLRWRREKREIMA